MKVVTQFIYPPIPIRTHDWMAYFPDEVDGATDGHGNGPTGYGATEVDALKNLIEEAIDYFQTIAYADGRKDEAEDQRLVREEIAAKRRMVLEETCRAMNETGQGEHLGVKA
jgi:hypothetical protein